MYRLNANNGRFLEGYFEAAGAVTPSLRVGFWVMGSVLDLDGDGEVESMVIGSDNFVGVSGQQNVQDSSYYRSMTSFGVLTGLSF